MLTHDKILKDNAMAYAANSGAYQPLPAAPGPAYYPQPAATAPLVPDYSADYNPPVVYNDYPAYPYPYYSGFYPFYGYPYFPYIGIGIGGRFGYGFRGGYYHGAPGGHAIGGGVRGGSFGGGRVGGGEFGGRSGGGGSGVGGVVVAAVGDDGFIGIQSHCTLFVVLRPLHSALPHCSLNHVIVPGDRKIVLSLNGSGFDDKAVGNICLERLGGHTLGGRMHAVDALAVGKRLQRKGIGIRIQLPDGLGKFVGFQREFGNDFHRGEFVIVVHPEEDGIQQRRRSRFGQAIQTQRTK